MCILGDNVFDDTCLNVALSIKFNIVLFLICILCSCALYAQKTYSVKGLLIDTASNAKIDNATIIVLNAKDSVLQKFVYSTKGNFEVNDLKSGDFLLMVTYPDYADFVAHFKLDETQPEYHFGNIKMILKAKLLEEVIIKSKAVAMTIKGDTTEFNAAAYATHKNAKVDDLLKQFNGMRISQNGDIMFQGEPVSKILVDGEEFFGDDPALVSKTIRADMVNKIQVFDQKSEKAKLTGIDDGVKVKTINIVLLEDKRKGIFGNANAGLGTDKYHQAEAKFSKFSLKQKFSVNGNFSNTGKALDGRENFQELGIPEISESALHYDAKWNKDKQTINVDYSQRASEVDGTSNTLIQNNLPGNFNTSKYDKTFQRNSSGHTIANSFTSKIDTTSDLRITLDASYSKYTMRNTNFGNTVRGSGILQNSSNTVSNGDNNANYLMGNARYSKRFKKMGRSFSVNVASGISNTKANNYLKSDINYYNEQGRLDSANNIDQYKPGINESTNFSTGFSYTDVLSKTISFSIAYSFSKSKNNSNQRSFNRTLANDYTQLDSTLSSDFRLSNLSHNYSASLSYKKENLSVYASTSIIDAGFKQTDLFSDVVLDRKFMSWLPNANLQYRLNKASTLSFNYYGYRQAPYYSQLQLLRKNTDPLNITLGNPALRPSFSNGFSYNYRVYQPTLDRGINFRGNYSFVTNAISNSRTTDSAGVNFFQYVNVKGKTQNSWDLYAEVYGHVTKLDFILFISLTTKGSTNFNFVNNQLNKVILVEYSPMIEISKNKTNYSYGISVGPNYMVNKSSLQLVKNNNSRGFAANANYYTILPHKFFMGSDFDYKFNGKNQVFDRNFERLIINSYIGKKFLKNENLKVNIKVNDLLNQNIDYYRNGTSDRFSETRNAVIKRYFMFSASWDFTKFGKSPQKQQ